MTTDISKTAFITGLAILFIVHFAYGAGYGNTSVEILFKQYFGGFIFVIFMFILSYRSIRRGHRHTTSSGPHHPRFPDGKHPKAKLQILLVFTVVLLIISAVAKNGGGI
jgi:hypothetical protein